MKRLSRIALALALAICLSASAAFAAALPVKALSPKQVDENPYMAKSDANIHHDGYNTDSTDEILPLGIYPEINVSYETTNANASPAIYFDSYGHAVVPLLGGIAIRDLNAEETKTLGYFSPKQHDGGGYMIQSSYTFLDNENRIVCPTSHNHVLMLRATDEEGNVLPEFEKVLDIDIKAAAEGALGRELTQNLLSVVFDYEGNLWFATGGFRIYPERGQHQRQGDSEEPFHVFSSFVGSSSFYLFARKPRFSNHTVSPCRKRSALTGWRMKYSTLSRNACSEKSRSLHQMIPHAGCSERRCSAAFSPATPDSAITALDGAALRVPSKNCSWLE